MKRLQRLLAVLCGFLLLTAFSGTTIAAEKVKIKSADGNVVVVFKRDGERVKIEDGAGNLLLKGKPRDDGGRKYKGGFGETQIKVSEFDGGFKLKTERGSLLWKVKLRGKRIAIANNNQGVMADQLRRTKKDKWIVEWDGEAQGKVKRYTEKNKIKVKDKSGKERYQIKGQPLSPMYAVLLLPRISPEDAYVIMAEMWLRGW